MGYRVKNYVVNITIIGCQMIHINSMIYCCTRQMIIIRGWAWVRSERDQLKYSCDHKVWKCIYAASVKTSTRHVHVKWEATLKPLYLLEWKTILNAEWTKDFKRWAKPICLPKLYVSLVQVTVWPLVTDNIYCEWWDCYSEKDHAPQSGMQIWIVYTLSKFNSHSNTSDNNTTRRFMTFLRPTCQWTSRNIHSWYHHLIVSEYNLVNAVHCEATWTNCSVLFHLTQQVPICICRWYCHSISEMDQLLSSSSEYY